MAAARVVICHGGIGLIGEAMRAGRPILVLPRRGRPTRESPAGDQGELVHRLAQRHPIRVCDRPEELTAALAALLQDAPSFRYEIASDVPAILARYLATGDPHSSRPARSS